MSIYLIGPMASGKSHIAKALAAQLKYRFYDTDDLVCQRTGMDIPTLFEKEGEAGFRKREAAIVRELASCRDIVVATGGGVILKQQNCDRMKENGIVVYLNTALDTRYKRMKHPAGRPLLMAGDAYEIMRRLDSVRTPLYEALADCVIDNNGSVAETTAKIIEYINRARKI